MAILTKTITLDYDVTEGSTTFDLALDLSRFTRIFIQVNYTDLDVGDSTIELITSLDNTRFATITGTSLALNIGATQMNYWDLSDLNASRIKLSYTHGTSEAGTIEKIFILAKE